MNEKELKAIEKAMDYAGINFDEEYMQRLIELDEVSIVTARNGRDVAWVIESERHEAAVYVDTLERLTLERLTEEETEKELC